VETVRELLARVLGFDARDVVLTGGGTEANHLALEGATHLVTSRLEHPSVALQAERLAQRGTETVFAQPEASGVLAAEAVEEGLLRVTQGELSPRPGERRVVAVMAANHETGVLQPLERIAEVARRFGAHLHVDAVQLLGRGGLEVLRVADSVSVASHKIRGARGVGALAFICGFVPVPLGRGGSQERGLRPGTIDAAAVAGFGAALARLGESVDAYRRLEPLRDRFEEALLRGSDGTAIVHGREVPRLTHVSNFRLPGWRGDELVAALDLEGVAVSSGSACSAGTSEPSAVILAMLGAEAAIGALRVSLGELTTDEEVDALLAALSRIGAIRPR
jgi:cysteine desulfurase